MPLYEAECRSCGKVYEWYEPTPTDNTIACPTCNGAGDRIFSRCSSRIFTPFITRNILPDGRPVEVKSQSQLSRLCNEHKLNHVDDPRYEPKTFTPPTAHDIYGSIDLPEARRGVDGGVCRQEDMPA